MKDQLVTYKTAKLAKECGFDVEQDLIYVDYGQLRKEVTYQRSKYTLLPEDEVYDAPTQSLLAKWLREKYKIFISVTVNWENEGDDKTVWYYTVIVRFDNSLHSDASTMITDSDYTSYEKALEAGLYNALKVIKKDDELQRDTSSK